MIIFDFSIIIFRNLGNLIWLYSLFGLCYYKVKRRVDNMTDNELLLAISDMLDKKLKPVNDRLKKIEVTQENEILPRLQNIEACYTSTYKRYQIGVEQIEALQADIEVIKSVVREHSEKLQKIS